VVPVKSLAPCAPNGPNKVNDAGILLNRVLRGSVSTVLTLTG